MGGPRTLSLKRRIPRLLQGCDHAARLLPTTAWKALPRRIVENRFALYSSSDRRSDHRASLWCSRPIAAPVRSRGVFRVPGLLFKVPAISSFAPPVPPTLGGSCKASRLRISTARRYWSLPEESMDGGMRAVELAKSRFGLGMAGRCNSDERTIGYGAVVGAAAPEQRRMLYWLLAQRIPAHGARS